MPTTFAAGMTMAKASTLAMLKASIILEIMGVAVARRLGVKKSFYVENDEANLAVTP